MPELFFARHKANVQTRRILRFGQDYCSLVNIVAAVAV